MIGDTTKLHFSPEYENIFVDLNSLDILIISPSVFLQFLIYNNTKFFHLLYIFNNYYNSEKSFLEISNCTTVAH